MSGETLHSGGHFVIVAIASLRLLVCVAIVTGPRAKVRFGITAFAFQIFVRIWLLFKFSVDSIWAIRKLETSLWGLFEWLKIHVNVPLVYTDQGSYQRQETRSRNVICTCRARLFCIKRNRCLWHSTSRFRSLVTEFPNFIKMDIKVPDCMFVFWRSFWDNILNARTIKSIGLCGHSNWSQGKGEIWYYSLCIPDFRENLTPFPIFSELPSRSRGPANLSRYLPQFSVIIVFSTLCLNEYFAWLLMCFDNVQWAALQLLPCDDCDKIVPKLIIG